MSACTRYTCTHDQLCQVALRWLGGTRRCDPVFSRIASCGEIPDAIGWSSTWKWHGSTVVECKSSRSDFYADRKKHRGFRSAETQGWSGAIARIGKRHALAAGYEEVSLPRMGDFRFYLSEPEVITADLVEKHAPEHGLLHFTKGRVFVVRDAPRRTDLLDKDSEIRYLRFSIINGKVPHKPLAPQKESQL